MRASRAGALAHLPPSRFFVWAPGARYAAAVGDAVVGVVADATMDGYRVRLHGTSLALLPALAFDGATKRNKPALRRGDVVFARVAAASKHMEPELSCCAPPGAPKKDWGTGAGVYGALPGGLLAHVPPTLARRLLDPSCALLRALGAALPFQAAVGLNGLVWVAAPADAGGDAAAAAVADALAAAVHASEAECEAIAAAALARLAARVAAPPADEGAAPAEAAEADGEGDGGGDGEMEE